MRLPTHLDQIANLTFLARDFSGGRGNHGGGNRGGGSGGGRGGFSGYRAGNRNNFQPQRTGSKF